VRRLAVEAERGHPLSDELNSYPFDQRLMLARQIASIVREDAASQPNLVKCELHLSTAYDKYNREHLVGMEYLSPEGPPRQLYHLPGKIESLQNQSMRLNFDTFYSNQIGNRGREYFPLPDANSRLPHTPPPYFRDQSSNPYAVPPRQMPKNFNPRSEQR